MALTAWLEPTRLGWCLAWHIIASLQLKRASTTSHRIERIEFSGFISFSVLLLHFIHYKCVLLFSRNYSGVSNQMRFCAGTPIRCVCVAVACRTVLFVDIILFSLVLFLSMLISIFGIAICCSGSFYSHIFFFLLYVDVLHVTFRTVDVEKRKEAIAK